jgi:hypothetical protein
MTVLRDNCTKYCNECLYVYEHKTLNIQRDCFVLNAVSAIACFRLLQVILRYFSLYVLGISNCFV